MSHFTSITPFFHLYDTPGGISISNDMLMLCIKSHLTFMAR